MREKRSHATAATGTGLQYLRSFPSVLTLRSMNNGSWVVRECPSTSFIYFCGQRLAFPIEEAIVDT
jgi:hypothetical protein